MSKKRGDISLAGAFWLSIASGVVTTILIRMLDKPKGVQERARERQEYG